MNLATIPPGVPFLDELARWWLARAGSDPLEAADGLILLPTRRAARALTEAFLRASGGRPLLLPRIAALGALDEAPLALAGALDVPPAVPPLQRLAVLARMVLALDGAQGAPATADGAWLLARELANLLDEAHREEVDLAEALPRAAEAGYAEHWNQTIRFLGIVTRAWPQWLDDNGLIDEAARARDLLKVQADTWGVEPPRFPVVVAGTTGGTQATARLMRVVAGLPNGTVILPGLDLAMPEEVWNELGDGHPQAGMKRLLNGMGATRAEVAALAHAPATPPPVTTRTRKRVNPLQLALPGLDGGAEPATRKPGPGTTRAGTLWRALLPASALTAWRDKFSPHTEGLFRLDPVDQQEEAVAIALALRDALEQPNARAALVTPDRQLALRVAGELARYGVVVDDSAGENLADTPPGAFLRLLARAVADGFAPVGLLSVLKHPLAGFGLSPASCRREARWLERHCLRGPAPPPGMTGLRARCTDARATQFLDRLEARFAPLLAIAKAGEASPADALSALIEAAEAAADTDTVAGAARLWSHEEGDALAAHLTALRAALPILPAQPVATLPGLLDAALSGAVVRSRRALRGRKGVEHPRVAILGLLEARLQSFDVVVLGGLAEGVWPPATDPGPWMSRPMRVATGLTSPEQVVGQAAHDFAMTACAAAVAILSCPRRRDSAPAVPARWLVRLDAFLEGYRTRLQPHAAAHWARMLDEPPGAPAPVRPPAPRPPLAARPRKLNVTDIETWLRDPYAIYARYVLGLRVLDPLEQLADAADYGSIVHKAMAAFLEALPPAYPGDAEARLRLEMERALGERALRPALAAWWRPRLARIASWAAEQERTRRAGEVPRSVAVEKTGEWRVPDMAPPFTLTGRADRIERRQDGTLTLLDYKTGSVPKRKDVEAGFAPQLLLEAAMAGDGAFGADLTGFASELAYWRLTGGFEPGEVWEPFRKGDIPGQVEEAASGLAQLIAAFDDPARPYLSRPNPANAPRFPKYHQLARVPEWAGAAEEP